MRQRPTGSLSRGPTLIVALTFSLAACVDTAEAKKKGPEKGDRVISPEVLRAQRALEALEPRALSRWPASFGGLWIDGGKVFIAFTDRTKQRVGKLAAKFPAPKRLHRVIVDDSLASLRQLQNQMILDRQVNPVTTADPRSGRPIPVAYSLEIDVKGNQVAAMVHQPVTGEIVAGFAQRYGSDVAVQFLPPPEPLSLFVCTGRDNCPPTLRGGLVTSAETMTNCTIGFNVTYPSGNATVDGTLSAAHCGNPDADYLDDRSHAGYVYGSVVAEQQSGRVDSELHSVLGLIANSAPWSALAPWLYLSDTTKKATVNKVGTYASLPVGATVCKSGITTGTTCGEVLSKTYSFDSYVDNAIDFFRTSACVDGGDSGAPVYSTFYPFIKLNLARKSQITFGSRKAQGILSGSAKDTPCSDSTYYSLFGHIEFVADAFPITVTTP